jgi:hypothetical protein
MSTRTVNAEFLAGITEGHNPLKALADAREHLTQWEKECFVHQFIGGLSVLVSPEIWNRALETVSRSFPKPVRTCEAMIRQHGDLTGEGAEVCGQVVEPGQEFCESCSQNVPRATL